MLINLSVIVQQLIVIVQFLATETTVTINSFCSWELQIYNNIQL